ncbi:DUF1295 domain-containing protein [Spirosoma sp. SC4-14]|uniref:DUF1295 domain-containing protein n=1 Tax=Spirosoma sp. SC4-14 TaxID=3128900 RepID=UPI0030CFDE5E
MDLYSQKSKSIPQKLVIHILELVAIYTSYWLLFQQGGEYVQQTWGIQNARVAIDRRTILFAFNLIVFLRIAFTMFVFLKRKIPWEESLSVPFAFALYFVGYSLFVLPTDRPVDWLDYGAIALFLLGSAINTLGELLRDKWKKNPVNKGQLYTQGLFRYAMHINYFGDLVWVSAYAIITRNWYSMSIPLFLFCFFVFYNIPKLDSYLRQKYGNQFDQYARQTSKFIPFIY